MSTERRSSLIDAPTEILLEVIQHVPFDRDVVYQLAAIHPRINKILAKYEKSITGYFAHRNLPHASTDFPGEDLDHPGARYAWLSRCIQRYDAVDDIMAILVSSLNCYAVEKHNMALVNTGLLVFYRLQAVEDKAAFISSLPHDPLVALFLAIHYSTLTARYHSDGIINQRTYGQFFDENRIRLRSEIEFCFAEGAMHLGPEFIADTLLQADPADTTLMCLYHEHTAHDWEREPETDFQPPITQGPHQDPETKPITLFTLLQERLAELRDCPLQDVVGSIEDETDIPDHPLSWLSLAGKARLIQGLNLEARGSA
ncbi:hypothetical protein CC78DRAFT_228927 [Lojkania enalia]|uniref:Uncharacterized protein n=1 Tax=Lojkania enalia TaxID=147567 RepID=A0A9P4N8F3_9PLEO|nr:hypothetical protein CC78DRAFT_228927 [Didymosphaeria enalia]